MYSMDSARFCKLTLHCLLHVHALYLHPDVKLRSHFIVSNCINKSGDNAVFEAQSW